MTPDDLVKKYKQDIGANLSPDEREVLDAYISLRVRENTERVTRWSVWNDWAATILFGFVAASIVISLIGGFVYLVNTNEAEARVRVELADEIEKSRVMLETCEEENQKIRDVCISGLLGSK